VTVSETNSKARTIGYWVTTALVAFTVGSGGAAQLAHMPANVEGMMHLGYPAYLLTILGVWKVVRHRRHPRARAPTAEGVGLRRHLLRPDRGRGIARRVAVTPSGTSWRPRS
jgi:hypothetical protein